MASRTILAAVRSMCDRDGDFESRGGCRVTIGELPHDRNTSLFIVAGHPVFSLTFVGKQAELSCSPFSASFMTEDELDLSRDAINFVLSSAQLPDAKSVEAVTDGGRLELRQGGEFLSDGLQYVEADLSGLYRRLNAESGPRG